MRMQRALLPNLSQTRHDAITCLSRSTSSRLSGTSGCAILRKRIKATIDGFPFSRWYFCNSSLVYQSEGIGRASCCAKIRGCDAQVTITADVDEQIDCLSRSWPLHDSQ